MKWPPVTMQCWFILFVCSSAEIKWQETHDAPKLFSIMKMVENYRTLSYIKMLWNKRGVPKRWCTIFDGERKNLLALIIFSWHQFENALFEHPDVDLMAYFIASKCFAAKTGFPNRWLDVARSGFSKCLLEYLNLVDTEYPSYVSFSIMTSSF